MSNAFFEQHRETLGQAVQALQHRGYWSPFSESPSPRVYGETAADQGKEAYDARLNRPFELAQAATIGSAGSETSPYGFPLGISYPNPDPEQLLPAISAASAAWRRAGPEVWAGVSLEIIARLNARSFEIAHAVMHTTGQAFMMAFQAGGPHAQDRAVEAVAYAWQQTSQIPAKADWEKPQGKHAPLQMRKTYRVIPRGIGLVIGCCTFPTWNSYPGLFANLATGNAVIVKPHPGAILPLAITVEVAREVIAEAGFDPDIVTLFAHGHESKAAVELALRPEIKLVDFTGSSANGNWLEQNATQAEVYTEKSGVNQIVIDSTDDLAGMARNIAFSLCLYSGQMCTTPQNIYIPKDGIRTEQGHASFDAVAAAITGAIAKLTGDAGKAVDILGAIQNDGVLRKIEAGRAHGKVLLDSIALQHPLFPEARVRTPLVVQTAANAAVTDEFFGPVSFITPVDDIAAAIKLAEQTARQHGALTLSGYSTDAQVKDAMIEAAANAGVALSLNLTGGVFVNQSAAFSDYHGAGANPAANAALADAAFVAKRFRIVQTREPVAPPAAN